jgi:hypothetical protein
VTYYHDIRSIVSALNYANNIHDLEAAKRELDSLVTKYLTAAILIGRKVTKQKAYTLGRGERLGPC